MPADWTWEMWCMRSTASGTPRPAGSLCGPGCRRTAGTARTSTATAAASPAPGSCSYGAARMRLSTVCLGMCSAGGGLGAKKCVVEADLEMPQQGLHALLRGICDVLARLDQRSVLLHTDTELAAACREVMHSPPSPTSWSLNTRKERSTHQCLIHLQPKCKGMQLWCSSSKALVCNSPKRKANIRAT